MATSSKELLQSAKYAIKDFKDPEKQYSLNLINNVTLFQYNEEKDEKVIKPIYAPFTNKVNIGDPIQIKSLEYRNQLDDIYHILAQYLFISDINYNLRVDGDLQVTVNNLKAQDKLIQSLVKLIR